MVLFKGKTKQSSLYTVLWLQLLDEGDFVHRFGVCTSFARAFLYRFLARSLNVWSHVREGLSFKGQFSILAAQKRVSFESILKFKS